MCSRAAPRNAAGPSACARGLPLYASQFPASARVAAATAAHQPLIDHAPNSPAAAARSARAAELVALAERNAA
jgi:hypothetical protein